MAWTQTDTAIKYREHSGLTVPAFSGTAAIADLEREQWRIAKEAADRIIKSKVVGHSSSNTATYTVVLSGTSTTGHGVNDTITVTVTSIAA